MGRVTIAAINKRIAHHGVEVVRGLGYFYFMALDTEPLEKEFPEIDSVYTMRLDTMSVDDWVSHVDRFFA